MTLANVKRLLAHYEKTGNAVAALEMRERAGLLDPKEEAPDEKQSKQSKRR